MNRTTGRDQRAVVIRCTATTVTPADDTVLKNNQLKCNACHARSAPTNAPKMNVTVPMIARIAHDILTQLATGV